MTRRIASTSWSPETMIDRIGGDEELAHQLVALFIAECPRMLGELRASIDGGTADAVRRAAHAFKGSIGNFIDDGPMTTAFEIELLGKQERVAEAPALLARLEGEVEQLLAGMRAFEQGGTCAS